MFEVIVAGALLFFALRATSFVVRSVMLALLRMPLAAIHVARFDPSALVVTAIAIAKIVLGFAPVIYWCARVRAHRRIWFAFLIMPAPALCGLAIACCFTWLHWGIMAMLVALGVAAVRSTRRLQVCAFLPLLLFLEPAATHLIAFVPGTDPARRCALNDGVPPINRTPAQLGVDYHSITSVDADHLLLTAAGRGVAQPVDKRASWWLSRQGADLRIDRRSRLLANLWNGCLMDGAIWYITFRELLGVRPAPPGNADNPEEVERIAVPSDPGDMDKPGPACDVRRQALYFGDALKGKLYQYSLSTRQFRTMRFDALAIQPLVRNDGRVVVLDSTRISVFDPDTWTTEEQFEAGSMLIGFHLCANDGAVVVADLVGRVREFRRTDSGAYRFAWGLTLPAPRRIRYSDDCRYIGVTSADDSSVFIVDRESHGVKRTFHVGPALRDINFLGPRTLAAVDACSVERLDF